MHVRELLPFKINPSGLLGKYILTKPTPEDRESKQLWKRKFNVKRALNPVSNMSSFNLKG